MRADERVAQLMRVRSLPCELVVPFIYPRVYSLHDLADEHGRPVVEVRDRCTVVWIRISLVCLSDG